MTDNRTKALMIAGQCWCDPETSGIEVDARLANSFADRVVRLLDEIDTLRESILRLAEQDATLSVQGGNVIVEMDATLTDAEREAIEEAICDQESYIADCRKFPDPAGEQRAVQIGDTLRGLLERTGGGR